MHSLHVAHRDIKPDNLLVADDGTVKICDFSVSQSFEDNDDRLTYSAGSPVFLSPELCERKSHITNVTLGRQSRWHARILNHNFSAVKSLIFR